VSYGQEVLKGGMERDKPVRILVADDYVLWRDLVHSLLQAHPEWEIVGEACDGLEAVRMTNERLPDIVLLDIGMPVLNGLEAAKRIRQGSPTSKIIFATQNNDAEIRMKAVANGADAYLLKANAGSELVATIEAALNNAQCPDADFH